MNGSDSKTDSKLNEISFLLNRYALRQKNLRALTWPEKVRLVEKARESVLLLKFSTKGLNPNKPNRGGR